MSNERSPRILISRLGVIGDVVLTLPVACALREHFPNAYIGWVVEKPAAQIVQGHAALDAVITLQPGWSSSLAAVREAKKNLRSHGFDTALDCQGVNRSARASRLSGASLRIGFSSPYGGKLSRLSNHVRVRAVFPHLTDRSLELLTPLGIHAPRVQWNLPLSDEARLWAMRWRQSIKTAGVTVLNPSASWDSKLWDFECFAETARYIRKHYGHTCVVVWGNADDRIKAEKVVAASDGAAVLAPQTDLKHLAALAETADLFISGDAGPLHVAVAAGTPAIGLFGPTLARITGPYGQISLQKACEKGSLRHRAHANNAAMRAITVQHVCEAIDEVERRRRFINAA